MRTQTRKFLVNAAITVSAFVAAYVFCEAVVRFLYKDDTILFPRYHTDYTYGRYTIRGIRPNAEYWMTSVDGSWKYVTNRSGFRNTQDFSYDKPANTIRVLSLGDSQTQGYEARQDFTFSAVLERVLNRYAQKAEVINSGVSGFSTAEELVFLENEGIKYQPDVVVLGFFANDFEDNLKAGLFELDAKNQLMEKEHRHVPGVGIQNVIYSVPAMRWLSENSYFYSRLFNGVWGYYKAKAAQEAEFTVPTSAASSAYQVALAAALVERMQKFCSDHGIRLIVVDIPGMESRLHFKPSIPPELLARFQNAHIEVIGSQALFQGFDGVAEMHAPHGDHHISEFTHTLIGTAIGQRLLAPWTRNDLANVNRRPQPKPESRSVRGAHHMRGQERSHAPQVKTRPEHLA